MAHGLFRRAGSCPHKGACIFRCGCRSRTRTDDLRVMSPVSLPLLYPAIYRGGVAEPPLCSSGTGRRYPTGGIHQTSNLTGKWHSLLSQTTSIFVADPPRYAFPNSRLHLGHRSKPSSTKAVLGVLIFFLALLKIHAPLVFPVPPSCGSRLKRLEIVIIYIFRCASLFPLPPLGEGQPQNGYARSSAQATRAGDNCTQAGAEAAN